MSDLHFDLHGLSVWIATEDLDLGAFVGEHFQTEEGIVPDAEIQIKASWRWGGKSAPDFSGADRSRMEKLGRGLALRPAQAGGTGAVRAVWHRIPDFPELTMAFELEGDSVCRMKLEAHCAYSPRGVGRRLEYLRPHRADRKRNRLFFKLMYFMVYYPMAWHLQRTRGWGLLHASAVTMPEGRAVILSGLGGVGKSTLALSMLERPGARLLSDNLIFHDEERIYSCPEPVRLDPTALKGMADGAFEPERTGLPLTAHPKPTYRIGQARRAEAGVPAAVYFLRFAPSSEITAIDPHRAAEMLIAGNDLAREIKDYRACSALLSMLAAERGSPGEAAKAGLTRLLAPVRCAIFRIGEGETISSTAGRLAEDVKALV